MRSLFLWGPARGTAGKPSAEIGKGWLTGEGFEDEADVCPKGTILNVLAVEAYLVGPEHVVVVSLGIILRCQQGFFVPVLQRGRAGDARPHPQNNALMPFEQPTSTRNGAGIARKFTNGSKRACMSLIKKTFT